VRSRPLSTLAYFSLQARLTFDFFVYASTAAELHAFFEQANAYDDGPRDPAVEGRRVELVSASTA
jgi:hypothetical protein